MNLTVGLNLGTGLLVVLLFAILAGMTVAILYFQQRHLEAVLKLVPERAPLAPSWSAVPVEQPRPENLDAKALADAQKAYDLLQQEGLLPTG